MQDVRMRMVAATVLSAAAFSGIPGAAAAFAWWIVFGSRNLASGTARRIVAPIVLIAAFGCVIAFTGGTGLSYVARMIVIILIGGWVYDEYRPGEFMDLSVWLLGNRLGFELGMIMEMGMQWLDQIVADFTRIQLALSLKGIRGIRTIVPVGVVLIHGSLARAGDTAVILAVRGYRRGGTYQPAFRSGRFDVLRMVAAICTGIFAILPVSEFFILYR